MVVLVDSIIGNLMESKFLIMEPHGLLAGGDCDGALRRANGVEAPLELLGGSLNYWGRVGRCAEGTDVSGDMTAEGQSAGGEIVRGAFCLPAFICVSSFSRLRSQFYLINVHIPPQSTYRQTRLDIYIR